MTTSQDVTALLTYTREQRAATVHAAAEGLRAARTRPLTLTEQVRIEETVRQAVELDDRAERLARLAREGD